MKKEPIGETKLGAEWQDPTIFELYEEGRALVRDATRKAVKEVFEKNVPADGVIVELGSGIGELSNIAPEEYKNKFIEAERTKLFSRIRKEGDKEARALTADINALPIQDNSVDTVVSYSVFDTLPDIKKALSETKRVLKKGGKFIHFLDLKPNMHVMMRELPPDVIPLPNAVGSNIDGFQLVKKEDYEKLKAKIGSPALSGMFDLYIKDPMFSIAFMLQNGMREVLVSMAEIVRNIPDIEKTVTPTLEENFKEKMLRELEASGFLVVSCGDVSAEETVLANKAHKEKSDCNYFENNVGSIHWSHREDLESELPAGYVKEKSVLFSIIAEKPE